LKITDINIDGESDIIGVTEQELLGKRGRKL